MKFKTSEIRGCSLAEGVEIQFRVVSLLTPEEGLAEKVGFVQMALTFSHNGESALVVLSPGPIIATVNNVRIVGGLHSILDRIKKRVEEQISTGARIIIHRGRRHYRIFVRGVHESNTEIPVSRLDRFFTHLYAYRQEVESGLVAQRGALIVTGPEMDRVARLFADSGPTPGLVVTRVSGSRRMFEISRESDESV